MAKRSRRPFEPSRLLLEELEPRILFSADAAALLGSGVADSAQMRVIDSPPALPAGTVWWALRAGSLLTGLLISLPAWRHADLLAVLPDERDQDSWDLAEDNEAARDERAVDLVFDAATEGERR